MKPDTQPAKAPLVPMVIPTTPMQFISMDQTAHTIIRAFSNHWLYIHGSTSYLLSDQGSNVDGDVILEFCDKFDIKKRQSSLITTREMRLFGNNTTIR